MRKKLQLWLQTSLILSLLDRASAAVYRMLHDGFFGRIFTAYSREEEAYRSGVIGSTVRGRVVRREGLVTRFRLAAARSFENSFFLQQISRLSGALLSLSLRVYGLFFSSFGMYVILIYLIKRYALYLETASDSHFWIGAILLIASLPLLASRQPLSEALLGSALMRWLLVHAAGIPRERLENRRGAPGRNHVAFILGMLFGALSYFISPVLMLAAAAALIVVMIVFVFPEVGVLAMIVLLPYLTILPHPSIMLAGMVLLTAFSYFIKLLRGKRVFHLELMDVAVLLFLLVFLFGGLVSFSGSGSLNTTAIYVCFMLGYFVVVNLIRTRAWLVRCVIGILASASGVALYGIWQNFFGVTETKWIDTEMFEEISGRVVSLFENPNMLANYLIMLIPLALAAVLCFRPAAAKFASIAALGVMGLCLIYTWSRGAWLGIIFGLLLFCLLWNRRTLSLLFLGLFALPFVPLVLPDSILSRLSSIGNLADSSTNYRVSIWRACSKIARDFFASGIGVGESAFRQVYPMYTLSGIEAAPHSHSLYLQIQIELGIVGLLIFLMMLFLFVQCCFDYNRSADDRQMRLLAAGSFAGIAAALVQGMTDYIWYNYRVFFVFWFMIALTLACIRIGRSEAQRKNRGGAAMSDASSASCDIPLRRI